jgi:hypothetical protein
MFVSLFVSQCFSLFFFLLYNLTGFLSFFSSFICQFFARVIYLFIALMFLPMLILHNIGTVNILGTAAIGKENQLKQRLSQHRQKNVGTDLPA